MAATVPQEVIDYLGAQKTLTLATTGLDGPWAATLTYVNDGPEIYIWTRPHSNTARHIDQNPAAAFAIGPYLSAFCGMVLTAQGTPAFLISSTRWAMSLSLVGSL